MATSESLQVGGHPDIVQSHPSDETKIMKRACPREVEFYEDLVHQLDAVHSPSIWSGWRPVFYGRQPPEKESSTDEVFIVLENLVPICTNPTLRTGFTHPNVLDIKLGKQLYDNDASEEKKERMTRTAAETTSARFGIRLTGGKVWNNDTRAYETLPKTFGKSLDPQGSDLKAGFSRFFPIALPDGETLQGNQYSSRLTVSPGGIPAILMARLLEDVLLPRFNRLSNHVSRFEWQVYGSSLLVVYEGDSEALSRAFEGDNITEDRFLGIVKLIDFAHAWKAQQPDAGLLDAFDTLSNLLRGMIKDLSQLANE
ncbi:uncharacterized protein MELLADRAFT_71264 [Melampsora larici-populina 98AG31]|uniref:Kinase n=1 Tax=Melampsora larici-populina (strain 98AG31 / pathotype 3-4-7) TaxID=747676 RepID=F4RE97_MELLP|nr:uncharacterized protein MELLADRAFT_71264 [Melampsora larici-populina 98AG31]EGG09308.1 hypothetical protein MELLADRAFT_71264 [Melampsora larici-populina 98AG31]